MQKKIIRRIIKIGNSLGVTIPKNEYISGVKEGNIVEITIKVIR